MKKAMLYLLINVAALSIPPSAQANTLAPTKSYPITTYSQKTLLKNWALSVCFAQITNDEKAVSDASATASAYLEFGKQDLDAYDELRSLVKKYVNLEYSAKPDIGQTPPALNTMKCIDLFHSHELDRLTRRLTKKK